MGHPCAGSEEIEAAEEIAAGNCAATAALTAAAGGKGATTGGGTKDKYCCGCGTGTAGSACIPMELAVGSGTRELRLDPGEIEPRRRGVSREAAGGDEFPESGTIEARNGVPEHCVFAECAAPRNTERVMPLPARAGEATSAVVKMRRGLGPAPQSRLAAAAATVGGACWACMKQPFIVVFGVAAKRGGETWPPVPAVLDLLAPIKPMPRHHWSAEMPPSSSDFCFVSL